MIIFRNSTEIVAQFGIRGKMQKHFFAFAVPMRAAISAKFGQSFNRSYQNELGSVLLKEKRRQLRNDFA